MAQAVSQTCATLKRISALRRNNPKDLRANEIGRNASFFHVRSGHCSVCEAPHAGLCSPKGLAKISGFSSSSYSPRASPKIDACLTLSIPRNSLSPNRLRVHPLRHFDTLSVYRGSLCEQVARARTNDAVNMKNQTIQQLQSRAVEKHRDPTHSTPPTLQRFNAPTLQRFNASTLQQVPACQAQSSLVKPKKYF